MHKHMAHHLIERPGGRTHAPIPRTRGRMRHHPLELILMDGAELPVPDPLPYSLGHALVHADISVYVLVADPLPRPPNWDLPTALVEADSVDVGMARFEPQADAAARHHYISPPRRTH